MTDTVAWLANWLEGAFEKAEEKRGEEASSPWKQAREMEVQAINEVIAITRLSEREEVFEVMSEEEVNCESAAPLLLLILALSLL